MRKSVKHLDRRARILMALSLSLAVLSVVICVATATRVVLPNLDRPWLQIPLFLSGSSLLVGIPILTCVRVWRKIRS